MDSDIAYFVTYPCPGCKLRARGRACRLGGMAATARRAACRPCRPEILLGHPKTRRRREGDRRGRRPDHRGRRRCAPGAIGPAPSARITPPTSPVLGALRLVFLTGLVISLFLLLIAYLDENTRITSIAGSLAIIFFLLTSGPAPQAGGAGTGRPPADGRFRGIDCGSRIAKGNPIPDPGAPTDPLPKVTSVHVL